MIRIALLYGALVGLAFGAAGLACYATTGPVPTCAQDPTQAWCSPPVHDERAPDAGR